jgi:inorganic triphosphatase YgiF
MELELKFALVATDAPLLEKQLARTPVIGRRKPRRQALHSTYFDTPAHDLQQAAMALRIRRVGDGAHPHWVQTLKMGGTADSAFSRRGEWEVPLQTDTLDQSMLQDTPWAERDPDGRWLHALVPVFSTTFERLSWIVQLGDARAEVALDRGSVHMDGHSTPLCELEIELLSGAPEALFDIAWQIGLHVALMPLHMSKAERAYRLAQGTLEAPLRARPPALHKKMVFSAVVQTVLRESFLQFTANLNTLRSSKAPEVLHQARVGWRRFRSALALFRQQRDGSSFPALAPLKPMLRCLTELRDLDVAASDVLPLYANAYQDADPLRMQQWQQLDAALAQAVQAQREALLATLADPAVGRTLLQITRWLELGSVHQPKGARDAGKATAQSWIRQRVARLARQLKNTPRQSQDPAVQHRLRILGKRLRYNVENLRSLLPRRRAKRWHQRTVRYQTRIGLARDRQLALATVQRLHAADGIIDFLRGAFFGTD